MTTATQIAETILMQLGGARFAAMTGANMFLADGSCLRFKLPRASQAIKHVRVGLTADDLYDVTFLSRTGRVVAEHRGVYAESLQSIFTAETGLYTHF